MKETTDILNQYGQLGVQALKDDVSRLSTTGETAQSIRYEVTTEFYTDILTFFGRKFFKALETGRGPRKSSEYQGYDKRLLDYLEAKGQLTGLTQKQKENKAKSLAWYINKHGDETYRSGGRVVFTPTIEKIKKEVIDAVKKSNKANFIKQIKDGFNASS